mgnify:FL=1
MLREHQQFHVGLKAFIADGEKLLILQDTEGTWELPGGRAEKAEAHKNLREILIREVTEELGEEIKYDMGPVFHAWIRKPEGIGVAEIYANSDLHIFLVGFRCIYKEGEVVFSKEHKDFKWITKQEVDGFQFENTYKDAIKYYFQSVEK